MTTEPPAYLFRYPSMSKSKRTKITITTSTRRHNRHPIPRMSPVPTVLPSTAFPVPPAFPPSVKRCLGPRTNTRNKKMTSPHEKLHRVLIMNDFYQVISTFICVAAQNQVRRQTDSRALIRIWHTVGAPRCGPTLINMRRGPRFELWRASALPAYGQISTGL